MKKIDRGWYWTGDCHLVFTNRYGNDKGGDWVATFSPSEALRISHGNAPSDSLMCGVFSNKRSYRRGLLWTQPADVGEMVKSLSPDEWHGGEDGTVVCVSERGHDVVFWGVETVSVDYAHMDRA